MATVTDTAAFERWQRELEAAGPPERPATTVSGVPIEPLYTPESLNGFDPEQNRRLGFYYAVRDSELGEQVLSVGSEFPYWEDPSLWSVLELTGDKKSD